mmetsp:Transcript_32810/g.38488  ORF Transcript_32810/g.38488 Transcript_32810/m.38488 type:complete len:277 (-) Transcript_32810:3226-4056(-)
MSIHSDHHLPSVNVFLSSDKADHSISSSRKFFQLKTLIDVPSNTNLMISLTSFNCPYSWYLIREGVNDSFKIITFDGATQTEVEKTITIPQGSLFALTANYTTNKFYLTSSVALDQVVISDVSCFKILGIGNGETLTFNSLSTLQFPNIFDFSGSSCLYVILKNRNINNMTCNHTDGVLQRINIECLPMEYIYFKPIEYQYFITHSEHPNYFDVSIVDEEYNQIDFNGGVFRLTFTLQFQYHKVIITQNFNEPPKIEDEEKNEKKETIEKKEDNKK